MPSCGDCGKKETKTCIIVNNGYNHCIEKMDTTNTNKGVSRESLTTKIDDDESLNNISFGGFKVWLENKFMKHVINAILSKVKVVSEKLIDEITMVKGDLKNDTG